MFFLSWRNLTAKKKQTFFTLLGIVLGCAAYFVISSMMLGFQEFIIDQLVNNDSHVRISVRQEYITPEEIKKIFYDEQSVRWINPPSGRRDQNTIQNVQGHFQRLDRDHDIWAYSPQLVVKGLAIKGKINQNVKIIGANPEKQSQVTTIEKYMLQGKYTDIARASRSVAIGDGVAKQLGLRLKDTLMLSGTGGLRPFKVVGIFRLGVKTLDDTTIFTNLTDAQDLADTPGRISDIAIKLNDVTLANSKSENWSRYSLDKVQSWQEANEGIMSVFKTQDIVRNFMTISILIVAGFGIYNILSMAVAHKRKDIAILRSIGFTPRDVINIFLFQGIILGLTGGVFGVCIGHIVAKIISTIPVSPDRGLGQGTMMMSFSLKIYVKAFLLASGSAIMASVLPARNAGKLNPMAIFRGEE